MTPPEINVCRHGGLRRQCEPCDLADQLASTERAHANLRAAAEALLERLNDDYDTETNSIIDALDAALRGAGRP